MQGVGSRVQHLIVADAVDTNAIDRQAAVPSAHPPAQVSSAARLDALDHAPRPLAVEAVERHAEAHQRRCVVLRLIRSFVITLESEFE